MPMKLNVGLCKKVGQPDYGSVGASCHVELELEGSLLQNDPDAFHRHIRTAFTACTQAVNDELARHSDAAASAGRSAAEGQRANGHSGSKNGHAGNGHSGQKLPRRSRGRSATASQIKAIHAIARSQGVDLAQTLKERYGVGRPDDLSVTEASELIDALKGSANGSGDR